MNKLLLLAILAGLLAGCTTPLQPTGCHKTTALGGCNSGRYTDQDEYGRQAAAIKEAIESRLADRNEWQGKKCRMHLVFAPDGMLLKVTTSDGNKQYCAALQTAAMQAHFPPFPNKALYDTFAQSRFDMKGE